MKRAGTLHNALTKTQIALDAMPGGAVVIDAHGHAWQKGGTYRFNADHGYWYRAYDGIGRSSFEMVQVAETVTLIYPKR